MRCETSWRYGPYFLQSCWSLLAEKATKIGGALLGVPVRAISVATKTRNVAQVLPTMATFGALGVVYGDIGTSPLYALREATKAASGGACPRPRLFWVLSR